VKPAPWSAATDELREAKTYLLTTVRPDGRPHQTTVTRASPEELRGKRMPRVARVLDEAEAAELWPFLDETYGGFRRYRGRTPRQIPIVELTSDPDLAA
jgi:hypothetical protein